MREDRYELPIHQYLQLRLVVAIAQAFEVIESTPLAGSDVEGRAVAFVF
jgi:hypothetical protein